MKIAVLYGGTSKERDVSLSTGAGMIKALEVLGHDVVPIDFNPAQLTEHIQQLKQVDLVFIGLHGKQGEDGTVQGLLDLMSIPYLGSGVLASSLAMDKTKSKKIFSHENLPVARSKTYDQNQAIDTVENDILNSFSFPFVVKPNQEGSTLGLSFVHKEEELVPALELAFKHDHQVLVEDFIEGKELTVAVIGRAGEEKAWPIIEIIPKGDYYDYEAKYSEGGSEHIVPADLNPTLTDKIQSIAVKAHQSLGCSCYSRVDFILQNDQDPIILEVNTLPGMTPTSLFPDAASAVGLTYEDMIDEFIQLTLSKKQND